MVAPVLRLSVFRIAEMIKIKPMMARNTGEMRTFFCPASTRMVMTNMSSPPMMPVSSMGTSLFPSFMTGGARRSMFSRRDVNPTPRVVCDDSRLST